MNPSCKQPLAWDALCDYYAHDLPAEAELEAHLFDCSACAERAASLGTMVASYASLLPPLLSQARLRSLRAEGKRILENPMQPGERKTQVFPRDVDVLLHRLGGLSLTDAARVSFTLRAEGTDHLMVSIPDAPFDRDSGEVLLCCQRHYAGMPPDTVAELRVEDATGRETVATYTILHRFEG